MLHAVAASEEFFLLFVFSICLKLINYRLNAATADAASKKFFFYFLVFSISSKQINCRLNAAVQLLQAKSFFFHAAITKPNVNVNQMEESFFNFSNNS